MCGKHNIDYELPGYQFDLKKILSDQNVLYDKSQTNSIYKQNWKFVTSLKLNIAKDNNDNMESILFLTNNKKFQHFNNNKNVITVLLTNNNKIQYNKITNTYYELNANKEMFTMLQNDIQKMPQFIIYYFDEIKGILYKY